MNLKLTVVLSCLWCVLTGAIAFATTPVSVFPNPINFGTVPLNSTSSPFQIFVSNTSTSAVTVSNMTITGTNSANFAFFGFPCTGTISGGQTCEMYMTFTPSSMMNLSATLAITETGVTGTINIPLQGTGGNPIPVVTSLSPPTVYVNSPSTTITFNGSGFLSSTVAFLQGTNTALPTTFVSATQIKAQIPDTALSNTGQLFLYVANPAPGGGTASTSVEVISQLPIINGTTPSSVVAGTASEPVVLNGQNFAAGAQVEWNGTKIPTTYVSSTQLQVQPTTTQLGTAGIVQITVTNPAPGTISSPVSFDVTYALTVTVLDLPANDLVWDPFAQLIYASMPSSYGVNGNSIAVINPSKGVVNGYNFAGSEPTKIAIDSTSKFLYAGLNGNGSIQRLNLPAFTPDIQISLGDTSSGPNLAQALAVSPTDSHTIAAGLSGACCSESGPLEFFTDSSLLANSITSVPINQVAFASGTTLYGYSSATLSQVSVTTTGGTLTKQWNNLVTGNTFQYSGGLIFGSNGQEFNPATGLLLGTFDVGPTCCGNGVQLLPNSALGRAFALGVTPFFNSFGITSYNLTQFTPVAVADLSGLSNGSGPFSPATAKLIPWGTNGLAFILTSGCCGNPTTQVVLVQSPTLLLTSTKSVSSVPVATSTNPTSVTHGSGNFLMTLKGSGFVPGSVVTWNGRARSVSYVSQNKMTVYVPGAAVASAGIVNIVVKNPAPGGGKSSTLTFTVK